MFTVVSIATVANNVKVPMMHGWGSVESELVFEKRYLEGLRGLEEYSHVVVVFWMDRAAPLETLRGRVEGVPDIGVFARRAISRPNPIGVSSVPIIGLEGNVLRVRGLDAIDGTPVLDIKPYTPAFDRVEEPHVPEWSRRRYDLGDYF